MDKDFIHKELSESIIGAAMTVLNTLRPGLDEKLYENALVIELRKRGHIVDQQRSYPVHYDGQLIGTLVPHLIVDGLVIADPKVVTAFNETHLAQMLGYLNITGLKLAMLLNFKNLARQAASKGGNNRESTSDNGSYQATIISRDSHGTYSSVSCWHCCWFIVRV